LPVLKTTIAQRIAFADAATSGSTVLETEPQSLAAHEIEALVREVLEVGA
jgi:chromosome partitioning protein